MTVFRMKAASWCKEVDVTALPLDLLRIRRLHDALNVHFVDLNPLPLALISL